MTAVRACLAALLLCFAFAASADVAVPPLTGRIVDRTNTLSSDRIATLDATLRDFERRKGSQIAVLLVPTTAPETIAQFSLRVAEQWKIGRKKVDDGAILVVAKDDRALRIEVGYGLEGALNDATAKRIIDEVIVPKFRSGDFAGGIEAGIARMLKVIDGEPLPAPKPEHTDTADENEHLSPYMLVLVLVVGGFLRQIFGRLYGALITGAVAAGAAYFLIGTLWIAGIAGVIAFVFTLVADSIGVIGPNGGIWSGGSSSSSSGGGFSGGGGSFGGGGASGKW